MALVVSACTDRDSPSCDDERDGAWFSANLAPCADPECLQLEPGAWGDPLSSDTSEPFALSYSLACTADRTIEPADEPDGFVLEDCVDADGTMPGKIVATFESNLRRRLSLERGERVRVEYALYGNPGYSGYDFERVWSLRADDGALVAAVGYGRAPGLEHVAPLGLEVHDEACPPTPGACGGETTRQEVHVTSDDGTVVVRNDESATVGLDVEYDVVLAAAGRTSGISCGYYSETRTFALGIVAHR